MKMEFGNIFGNAKKAELVASSKPGNTDNTQVGENFSRPKKLEEKDTPFKRPDEIIFDKIYKLKMQLSDILNRNPLVKSDREEASMVRDNIKSLEKDLEDYQKSQLN